MNLKSQNNNFKTSDRLSLSRNLTRPQSILELKATPEQKVNQQLKYVLKVYISDDERKFIDRAAAYALGFINVRAIMLRDEPNLFEITEEQIKQAQRKNYEIEYHELKVNNSFKTSDRLSLPRNLTRPQSILELKATSEQKVINN